MYKQLYKDNFKRKLYKKYNFLSMITKILYLNSNSLFFFKLKLQYFLNNLIYSKVLLKI